MTDVRNLQGDVSAALMFPELLNGGTLFVKQHRDGGQEFHLHISGIMNGYSGIFEFIFDPHMSGISHALFRPNANVGWNMR